MQAFLDPADWATWLGESGNDPAAAKAACKTTEGIRWTMTQEERKRPKNEANLQLPILVAYCNAKLYARRGKKKKGRRKIDGPDAS